MRWPCLHTCFRRRSGLITAAGLIAWLWLYATCSIGISHAPGQRPPWASALPPQAGAVALRRAAEGTATSQPDAPTTRLLSTRLSSGTCNQRLKLRNALLLASLTHRTLLLPRVFRTRARHGAAWADADPASTWRDEALSVLFDVPYLLSCAAKLGVSVVSQKEGSADMDPPTLEERRLTPDDVRLNDPSSPVSSTRHLIVRDLELWSGHVSPSLLAAQVSHDSCITWAAPLVSLATQLAEKFEARIGKPISAAVAVHLRVEDDVLADFSPRHTGPDGKEVLETYSLAARMVTKAMLCLEQIASDPAPPFYLITGESLSSPKLSTFSSTFRSRITSKEDLLPALVTQAQAAWGIDAIVALNFQLALEAAEFVGYAGSTFSQQVSRERLARGRTSLLYNDVGIEAPECARVTNTMHIQWGGGRSQQIY